jgi:hypothetical protein
MKVSLVANMVITQVKEVGISVVPNFFSQGDCNHYVEMLEQVLLDRVKSGAHFGSRNTQVLYNFFLYNPELFELIHNPLIDEVMTALIDEDFVLISPSARNPRIRQDFPEGHKTSGVGWHVDSRVYNKQDGSLYRPSLSFYAAVALEEFSMENAATLYIPYSHLRYQKPLDRNADLEHEFLLAPAGSLVFFDSALWHKVGDPTLNSRWSIFNMYGPWFMKPYFQFPDNYDFKQAECLHPTIKKILHFNSTPPSNETEGTVTLIKHNYSFTGGKN